MMTVPLAEANGHLDELQEQLTSGHEPDTARLTENGRPVLALLPWELYESLLQLAEVAQDPGALLAAPPEVRERILAAAAGRAEALYRSDSELADFEAFGERDLIDTTG